MALANMNLIPPRAREKYDQSIGYWCEDKLREFRRLDWTVEMPKTRPVAVAAQAGSGTFRSENGSTPKLINMRKRKDGPRISGLQRRSCLSWAIVEERVRGATAEADRFG